MRQLFLGGVLTLLVSFAMAGPVSAEDDDLGCADYISGGPDNPASGFLIGTEKRTETVNVRAGFGGGGVGASYSVSYEVGIYEMHDGELIEVDCRTYRQVRD